MLKKKMPKKTVRCLVTVFFSCIAFLVTACGKKSDITSASKNVNTAKPTDAAVVTSPATEVTAMLEEPENINYDQYIEEYASDTPFQLETEQHNIFSGTFGSEQVKVDIWPEADGSRFYVQVEGDFHSEVMKFEMLPQENQSYAIEKENGNYFMVICQTKDEDGKTVLSGLFGEKNGLGEEPVTVTLKLAYINYTPDQKHLYSMGEDEEVSDFSQKVLDAIMIEDSETLADMIQYPVNIKTAPSADNTEFTTLTIQNREQFISLSSSLVFTSEFVQSMSECYSDFMFSNQDGIMLGTDTYNVWISQNEKGKWVVVSINN
ncbi:MAG: hypothetical protein PUB10_01545 [Clostridiales bacterium]|nr:hypothetical protein [Clostridiales bacterium]